MSNSDHERTALLASVARGVLYGAPAMVVAAVAGYGAAANAAPADRTSVFQDDVMIVAQAEAEAEGEAEAEAEAEGEAEAEAEAEGEAEAEAEGEAEGG